jgi:hypothetical protein
MAEKIDSIDFCSKNRFLQSRQSAKCCPKIPDIPSVFVKGYIIFQNGGDFQDGVW